MRDNIKRIIDYPRVQYTIKNWELFMLLMMYLSLGIVIGYYCIGGNI